MNKPKHILLVENHAGFLRTIRKFLTATVFLEKGVSMAIIARCFYIVFIIFTLSAVAIPIEAAEWYLFSRHGECAEIKVLERKIPDLDGIENPEAFIKLVRKRGYEVFVDDKPEFLESSVGVKVPEKGLAVMFVKKFLCKGFIKKDQ